MDIVRLIYFAYMHVTPVIRGMETSCIDMINGKTII